MKASRIQVAHHGTCALGKLSPINNAGAVGLTIYIYYWTSTTNFHYK